MTEERCRLIVQNSPYGIYRVTFDGRFVAVNPALCAIVGYTQAELLASNISILYPEPGDWGRWLADYELRPPGAPAEVTWKCKDGRLLTTRIWARAACGTPGAVQYFDGYVENAHDQQIVRKPVAATPFFDELTRALTSQLADAGVVLHTCLSAEVATMTLPIDRVGIEQAVTNLVINAAQAAESGGTVWLQVKREASDLVIQVVDDGAGIPEHVLPQMFEPFFTTRPIGEGTGLGLPASRRVVQRHGGWITAANRAMSGETETGARFTIRIPLPAQAIVVDSQGDAAADARQSTTRRVLIVDHEDALRRALARFYRRRGWTVTQAETGSLAFERLIGGCESYDLVVSDVKMPGISGVELHAAMSEVRPDLIDRLLFGAGEVDSPAISAFVADTHCPVLAKPFDLSALASLSDAIASRNAAPRVH